MCFTKSMGLCRVEFFSKKYLFETLNTQILKKFLAQNKHFVPFDRYLVTNNHSNRLTSNLENYEHPHHWRHA